MRLQLLTLGIILLFAVSKRANSQCELPQLEDWQFTDTSSVELLIDNSVNADSLVVLFELMTEENNVSPGPLSSDTLMTDIDGGDQIIAHEILYPPVTTTPGSDPISPENRYHGLTLGVICEGDTTYGERGYIAYSSLLTSSSFDAGEYFESPVQYIPDGSATSLIFNLDSVSAIETVQDLDVFVDVSHSFLGDLDIELISPSQDTVKLHSYSTSSLATSNVLSVVFDDESGNSSLSFDYIINRRLRGIFQPDESLEEFDGLPVSGQWELRIADNILIDDGYLFGASLIFNGEGSATTYCDGPVIAGKAFLDYNSNGEKEEEEPLAQGFVEVISLDSTWFNYSEGSYGVYNVCAPPGTNQVIFSEGYQYFEPVEDTLAISAAWPDSIGDADFPLQPTLEGYDMSISAVPQFFEAGFQQVFHFQYSNQGVDCADEVIAEVVLPDEIEIIDVSNGGSIVDNSVTWDVAEACPGTDSTLSVTTYCAPSLLGETLPVESSIEANGEDLYPEDNTHVVWEDVIGSFDPNDIQVDRDTVTPAQAAGEIALNYRIRFQNTGTAPAQTVEIENEIGELLDLETLQITGSSHEMSVQVEENLLTFVFDQINLPDSSVSQEESQGYVSYRIYPTPQFVDDEVVENDAAIYFDFNEPIFTNIAETRIFDFSSTGPAITENPMRIYPNPAADVLNVDNINPQSERLFLYDLSGRVIMGIPVHNRSRIDWDVSSLESGVYLLSDNRGLSTFKIVVDK